jgi:hypothetical protein
MQKWLYCSLYLALSCRLFSFEFPQKAGDLQIHIQDVHLEDDVLSTDQGAVIYGDHFRIQAKKIKYTRHLHQNPPIHTLVAEDDLMVIFEGRIFIGSKLEFDFVEEKGVLTNGLTYDNLWFVGGTSITFQKDRTIAIDDAYLTTSESPPEDFALWARHLTLKPNEYLYVQGLKFTVRKIPVFYLPTLYANLKKGEKSRVRYKVTWDKGQGPKFSMRYNVYSSLDADVFFRFDFRFSRGLAGAIETDYDSSHMNLKCQSKSYLAHDTFFNDNNPNQKRIRYRLQGILEGESDDETLKTFVRYDKISDKNMPLDFPGDDFELNTAQRTELIVYKQTPISVTNFYFRPNINNFQGFKQELPTFNLSLKPLNLGASGILSESRINTSFLDYQYATDLGQSIPGFQSLRLELHELLSRPIDLYFVHILPKVGYDGIFYSQSPLSHNVLEQLLNYGVEVNTTLKKKFSKVTHLATPYFKFDVLHPFKLNDHYIFSLQDGYDTYETLKIGLKNYLMSSSAKMTLDVYALRFLDQRFLTANFPKLGLECNLLVPLMDFDARVIYNDQSHSFDEANFGIKWTLSEYFAIKTELRHRGKYAYRKVDFDDYILDVNRNPQELIKTPISDPRNSFISTLQLNLTRNTTIRFQSHTGWARPNQPSYTEYKLDILSMIASNWRFRLSFMHLVNDDQVSFGLSLIPNP